MYPIANAKRLVLRALVLFVLPLSSMMTWGEVSPEAALGWKLFFDHQLSRTGTHACSTCHDPKKGFADGVSLGTGAYGDTLPRNTPTVVNLAQSRRFFWDGRAGSLEEQAVGPLTNPIEMDLTLEGIVSRVKSDPQYRKVFATNGATQIDIDAVVGAIATFERGLKTGETAFDRWLAGDKSALTAAQQRGRMIFFTRGQCATCHIGEHFTDNDFHNIGTGTLEDLGRFSVTGNEEDKGVFKTPSLRNWKGTEPFMHNGAIATMEDIVDFYSDPLSPKVGESELDALEFDKEEKSDLLAFLETLNGRWPDLSGYAKVWQDLLGDTAPTVESENE